MDQNFPHPSVKWLQNDIITSFNAARDESALVQIMARLAPHERTRLQEIEDLSAGQAGRSNGRIALGGYAHNNPRAVEARKAKAAEAAMLTALQIMLADPAYRALFDETADILEQYERAAAVAMAEAELALDSAEEALAVTMADAARLEDGTRVFRGDRGEAITEHAVVLDEDAAASIVGLEEAPLYSTYIAQKQAVADAEATINAILVYQVETLGDARDRLYDENDPITDMDDMRQMQDSIRDAAPAQMSRAVDNVPEEPRVAAPSQTAVLSF